MLNSCKSKLIYNLNSRSMLLSILILLVLAGPAVTLPGNGRASDRPVPPASRVRAASANPAQSSTPCPISTNRSLVGEFSPVIHLPLVPVHLSVLPDKRVLFWGRDKTTDAGGNLKEVVGRSEAYVWDIPDGSNKTDVAVFRPSEGRWYIINSSNGVARFILYGMSGDVPVPGDYDGDGRADIAVYRPSEGTWYILNSSTEMESLISLGLFADITAPADYDGDGKTDAAVFRPSEGNWYIRYSAKGTTQTISWGASGDVPVPKDYDADRKADIAVFRPSEGMWRIRRSSNGLSRFTPLGANGDVPVPGDYNGDGRADTAVFRPSDNTWRIFNEETSSSSVIAWGMLKDVAAPGDYDGDGKMDVAVFRPSEGNWHIRNSSDGLTQVKTWGLKGDILAPEDYDGMLRVANSTTNLFCSGHSFLPDGRLLVAGGHGSPDSDGVGEKHINIFDHRTNQWSRSPDDMNEGRWYPYNVTLGTGETLVISGLYSFNGSLTSPDLRMNLVPQIYTLGGSLRNLNQPTSLTFYPYLHLRPDGKVFQAQSGFTNPIDPHTLDQDSRLLDTDANQALGAWTSLGSTMFPHAMGTSVLFDEGRKVLVIGGFTDTFNPTKEAEFINLKPTTDQPTWTAVAPMNLRRAYHTATILPDGKVLVTGGVSCPGVNSIDCPDAAAMAPEMWDATAFDPNNPTNIPWCKMAEQKEVRAYHSVAALLPDGRVLVGGGGLPGAVGEIDANGQRINLGNEPYAKLFGHKNVEIYSPPYLFDSNGNAAARPSITFAPPSISYGETFFVGTSGAGTAPKVSLVRLASVTHGFNQDQRHTFLTATLNGSSGLNVTAPADSHKVPPGFYMLFVLNAGVPSKAEIIRVLETPAYEGYVDGSDCNQVWGWAWNRAAPNRPINVIIHANSSYIATVPANLFRQELLNADKGNGLHAFIFNVPASLQNGQMHSIALTWGDQYLPLFSTQLPSGWASGEGSTWEQATQFSSTMNGKITHIRFYKDSKETGTHTGHIWNDTGAHLASVTFEHETPSGWQEAELKPPLSITAGVRYRVSYNINSYTAKTFAGLNSPIINLPLTAHTSYFSTPAGAFPTTNSGSILFADVRFKASP